MNKRLLEIYALSVCFVSVGCLSIFSGIFLYGLVEISFPSTINSSRMYYPSPIFNQSGIVTTPIFPGQPLPRISRAEAIINNAEENGQLLKKQKQFEKLETERVQAESMLSIARSIIVILIASIVFIFHWRIAKRARSGNDT